MTRLTAVSHPRAHVLGSIALDRVYGVDRLPGHDEKAFIRTSAEEPGGPPLRLAGALARWGVRTGLAGVVGADPAGDAIVRRLGAGGLETRAIERRAGLRTPVNLIVVDATGERAILIEPVAEEVLAGAGRGLAPERGDAVIANLFHPDAVAHAFSAARRAGAFTLLDLELPELERFGRERAMPVLALTDILCTNRQVLDAWPGLPRAAGRIAAARRLGAELLGAAGSVCVTLGAEGVVAAEPSAAVHIPALDVVPRNTTGAGDTFAAALVKARLDGLPFIAAVGLGVAAAGLFVSEGAAPWPRVEARAAGLSPVPLSLDATR